MSEHSDQPHAPVPPNTALPVDHLLQPLLDDPDISAILVNGPRQIYIERRGNLEPLDLVFADHNHLLDEIRRVLATAGQRLDERVPMLDTRLPDGARLTLVLPPLALNGPTFTLRKPPREALTFAQLVRFGSLTEEMIAFLDACVRARLNIIVAGGMSSGKTTVMNLLTTLIPPEERIVTVEEVADLRPRHTHLVALESQPAHVTGEGGVSMQELLRMATRLRPDRLIIGEMTGPEVLNVLRLRDQGHDGMLALIFARSAQECLERLELLVKMHHPNLPTSYLRLLVSTAIDIIVQVNRLEDGSRRLVQITEVQGLNGDIYQLNHVFRFEQTSIDARGKIVGTFSPNPVSPALAHALLRQQITLPPVLLPPEL